MKPKKIIIISLLSLFLVDLSQAQTDRVAERQNLDLLRQKTWLYKLKNSERTICRRFFQSGNSAGSRAYKMRFKTCSDFLLEGGNSDLFFGHTDENSTLEEQCFQSGYRYGYVMENHSQWTPCADELTNVISEANAQAVSECQQKSLSQKALFLGLKNELYEKKSEEFSLRDAEFYAKILFFTDAGFGSHVWNDILNFAVKGQKELISCELILTHAIAEG